MAVTNQISFQLSFKIFSVRIATQLRPMPILGLFIFFSATTRSLYVPTFPHFNFTRKHLACVNQPDRQIGAYKSFYLQEKIWLKQEKWPCHKAVFLPHTQLRRLSIDVRTVANLRVSKRHFIFRRTKNVIISKRELLLLLKTINYRLVHFLRDTNSSDFTEFTDQKKKPFFYADKHTG